MQQAEIYEFLEEYFYNNQCEIVDRSPGHLKVQLTIDMDKELMNRPFYWHYLEKTGGIPNPASITFITNKEKAPEGLKGEFIHFGSPRLHQLFQSTKKLAGFVRLYEKTPVMPNKQTSLFPWLLVNIKISYECDQKKDSFRSYGLNLINGGMKEDFFDRLLTRELHGTIPDFTFTLTPIIKPKSGVSRILNSISDELRQEEHEWATEARKRWSEDLTLLDAFYSEVDELPESYHIEKEALKEQYEPRISLEIVNGGIIYLA